MPGQIPHGSDMLQRAVTTAILLVIWKWMTLLCSMQQPGIASEHVLQVWCAFYSTPFKLFSTSCASEPAGSVWNIITKKQAFCFCTPADVVLANAGG